ncbi:MAG: PD40 domain-containing protein [Chloroflexi bacterium]|nr:PD40 domain-containing protein [Chloroflexota bacterium]
MAPTTSPFASPTSSPAPRLGKVGFAAKGHIWVNDLDSGGERRVVLSGTAHTPSWSADGRWIAFGMGSRAGGAGVGVWIVRAEGGDAVPVGRIGPGGMWQWSPVEDHLAFVDIDGSIRTVNADGSESREVVQAGSGAARFYWSPDGRSIAYERWLYGEGTENFRPLVDQGLWVVDADGSNPREVFSEWEAGEEMSVAAYLLEWSPDGRYLAFIKGTNSASLLADGFPLYLVSVADGSQTKLSSGSLAYDAFVSWSPDGTRIAYVKGGGREATAGKKIVVAGADGSAKVALSTPDQAAINPSWSPDGSRVAFVAGPAGDATSTSFDQAALVRSRRIWVADSNTGDAHQLTEDANYGDDYPQWSADGSHILFVRMKAADISPLPDGLGSEDATVELWLMRSDGTEQRKVVSGLTTSWLGYYGFIDWSQLFDWYPGAGAASSAGETAPPSASPAFEQIPTAFSKQYFAQLPQQ